MPLRCTGRPLWSGRMLSPCPGARGAIREIRSPRRTGPSAPEVGAPWAAPVAAGREDQAERAQAVAAPAGGPAPPAEHSQTGSAAWEARAAVVWERRAVARERAGPAESAGRACRPVAELGPPGPPAR